jgi:hypothetical protein
MARDRAALDINTKISKRDDFLGQGEPVRGLSLQAGVNGDLTQAGL